MLVLHMLFGECYLNLSQTAGKNRRINRRSQTGRLSVVLGEKGSAPAREDAEAPPPLPRPGPSAISAGAGPVSGSPASAGGGRLCGSSRCVCTGPGASPSRAVHACALLPPVRLILYDYIYFKKTLKCNKLTNFLLWSRV